MRQLPNWVLTNPFPAFYDSESGSAIEQTAKVYKAMQELNETIKSIDKDNEEFKVYITNLVENYIKMIDEKIIQQDKYINEIVLKEVDKTVEEVINSGKITAVGTYDETTEELNIVLNYTKE